MSCVVRVGHSGNDLVHALAIKKITQGKKNEE